MGVKLTHKRLTDAAICSTPLGHHPLVPLGFRKDGRPIFPVGGADDDGEDTPDLTHPQCLSRLEQITAEMERMAQKSTLSLDDENYIADLNSEFRQVDQRRAKLELQASVAEAVQTRDRVSRAAAPGSGRMHIEPGAPQFDRDSFLEPDSIEDKRFKNPWDLSEIRQYGREAGDLTTELRARALSAVEKMPQSNDRIRSTATDLIERWDDEDGSLSKLVLTISSPAYLRAWSKSAVDPVRANLSEEEQRALNHSKTLQRAMSLTDATGGYLVPFQLDPTLIITSDGSYNEIRQLARTVVATGDVWNGVSAGAVQWSFDPEASEVSDDSPTFAGPAIPIRTARGFVPISLEARMDAANVAAEVARLLAQGKDDLEAVKFATGVPANNEPNGIVTALTGVVASTVASTTADTFAFNDLYKVYGALPMRYRRRAAWLANNLFWNSVRQTAPTNTTWNDPGGDRQPSFLGRPVAEAEAMDGVINATVDNLMTIFGDFENYVIADRIGMTVDFIPHLFGANRRPTGQSGWFAFYRVGADCVNTGAFRVYNVT
jgi:HK97 family phage major capsid protein